MWLQGEQTRGHGDNDRPAQANPAGMELVQAMSVSVYVITTDTPHLQALLPLRNEIALITRIANPAKGRVAAGEH